MGRNLIDLSDQTFNNSLYVIKRSVKTPIGSKGQSMWVIKCLTCGSKSVMRSDAVRKGHACKFCRRPN
jgi:hypothetical protein